LPNVSGALLDACGRLAGYSIADGIQTIAPADGTRYHWQPALQTVFEGLGLEWAGLPCMPAEPAAEFAPPAGDGAEASGDQGVDDDAREPTAEAGADAAAESPPAPAQPVGETPPQVLPPVESALPQPAAQPSEPAAGEAGTAGWWLGAGLLLLASGFAIHRLRMRAVADPGAARGGPAEDSAAGPPGAAHVAVPDAAKAAAECRLLLRGHYADGRPLLVSAAVSARAINLEIGRGGADLALDSPAVSRRHARLSGTAAALTLADLGSGNGSSINGVPCLEGEIMYVEPGDTVILGDVRFVVELEPGSAPGGGGNAPP
jgi:hypothetical protein